jgi:hypothetical protein
MRGVCRKRCVACFTVAAGEETGEAHLPMLDQQVTSQDFIRAMMLVGFRMTGSAAGHVLLERADAELFVPQTPEIPPSVVLRLLEKANVAPLYFDVLLRRLQDRDTWPDVEETGHTAES